MGQNTSDIYETIKGFKAFSSQFEEAAAYMEHFNTDLAGSMNDLKEFYETNKEFTKVFSEDVKAFGERFSQLFASIDCLASQQAKIRKFMQESTTLQAENINILQGVYKEISESQRDLRETNNKMRQDFTREIVRLDDLLVMIANTAEEQKELVQTITSLRNQGFAEHVSLSNKIINKGFDSLVNKFENLDFLLGKYLSGLAFNASDLEGAIKELNQGVKAMEKNVKEQNRSIQQLSQLLAQQISSAGSPHQLEEGEIRAQSGEKPT